MKFKIVHTLCKVFLSVYAQRGIGTNSSIPQNSVFCVQDRESLCGHTLLDAHLYRCSNMYVHACASNMVHRGYAEVCKGCVFWVCKGV